MRAAAIVGLPVVTIDRGEDIAEIRDVVYDGASHTLVGFTLKKRGFWGGKLPVQLIGDQISAIGPEAVMIDSDQVLVDRADAPPGLSERGAAHPVIGTPAITTDGRNLGEVTSVVIETGRHPRAVGYEIAAPGVDDGPPVVRFVPILADMALSADNLVVPAEVLPYTGDDLDSFGQVLTSFRSRQVTP